MIPGAGAGFAVLQYVYHAIVDEREQARWFARWSISAARRDHASPDVDVESRAAAWRAWATTEATARLDDDDKVDEHPLIDPRFLRLTHVCWAADLAIDNGGGPEDARVYLEMADRALPPKKTAPAQPGQPADFQSEARGG